MAKENTSPKKASASSATNNGKKLTVAQQKELIQKYESQLAKYDEAHKEAVRLRDINQTQTKSISVFNKELLRQYMRNLGANEQNLRNLSWYLFYRSMTYMRLCHFYANMFYLNARSIIPKYDLIKIPDPQKTLKSYQDTLDWVERMHLQQEFYSIYLTCFVQDVFYGIYLIDETGVFIWQIPANYARIDGKYMTGDFAISMDMTYLRSRQELIEYIPEPFDAMYKEYIKTNQKWQPVPDEYAICLKYRYEDYETVLPPFLAAFNALINLADLEDIQAIADEQEIYKMIWLQMETIGEDVDDWKVNPELMLAYFQRMINEALPDYISAAIVPGKLNSIGFEDQTAGDTTKVSNATKTVLNTTGGAEILNGETISGAEAFRYSQVANTEFAISSLLPQTQAFVNRQLGYLCSNPCLVKFMPVSVYTRQQYKEDMLKAAQYSLPTKLAYMTLNGFSELDTLGLSFLENEVLKLQDIMVYPLNSSFTNSGIVTDGTDPVTGGRPTSTEPTDNGDDSAESRDKSNG